MARETCQLCKRRLAPDGMEQHHIVPLEVTSEAGIPESQTIRLCSDCHREVHSWYLARVSHTEYDLNTQRFRNKSYLEMVQEHQAAFSSFADYKGRQRKRAPR